MNNNNVPLQARQVLFGLSQSAHSKKHPLSSQAVYAVFNSNPNGHSSTQIDSKPSSNKTYGALHSIHLPAKLHFLQVVGH